MALKLVCTQDFGSYAKGDEITDPDAIADAQRDHAMHVVAVNVPDPDPAPDAKPAKGS